MAAVKTSQLIGPALDWAVATCQGYVLNGPYTAFDGAWCLQEPDGADGDVCPKYSTDWTQGGSLIVTHDIGIERLNDLYFPKGNEVGDYYEPYYRATIPWGVKEYGPTPLIAAMRCLVAAKLGDVIEVPTQLLE